MNNEDFLHESKSIDPVCPVCNSSALLLYTLNKEYIINNLEEYYGKRINQDIDIANSSIYKCSKCTLEFAVPLTPGSKNFYEWIAKHSNYYPVARVEWEKIYEELNLSQGKVPLRILEVGCGKGTFLNKVNELFPTAQLYGLDTNQTSIENCINKKINVYCETIEQYSSHAVLSSCKFSMDV